VENTNVTKKRYRRVPDGYRLIFRAWTTTKANKVIWAKWFGLRGFPILVRDKPA
jgi:hypothetical protein